MSQICFPVARGGIFLAPGERIKEFPDGHYEYMFGQTSNITNVVQRIDPDCKIYSDGKELPREKAIVKVFRVPKPIELADGKGKRGKGKKSSVGEDG